MSKLLTTISGASYAFNAGAGTVTFSGISLTLDQIALIVDQTAGVTIYQFNNAALGGSLSGDVLTLTYSTAALSNSDVLAIYVNVTSTQAVSGTVSVSDFPASQAVTNTGTFAVQDTVLSGVISGGKVPVSDSATLTLASCVQTFGSPSEAGVNVNNEFWGGIFVSPATTSALGTETAPVVRTLNRKVPVPSNSTTTALGANAVFTGTWVDTSITSGNYVQVECFPGSMAGNFVIQGSNDISNTNMTVQLTQQNYSTSGVVAAKSAHVDYRYWRVVYTNGSVAQTTMDLQTMEMSYSNQTTVAGDGSQFGAINSSGVTVGMAVPCTLASGAAAADNAGNNLQIAGNGVGTNVGVGTSIYNGSGWDRERAVNGMTAAGSPSGVQAIVEVPTTHANQASLVTGQTALTVANVKNAAGNLFGLFVVNPNASVIYLQFYNTASTPVLGTSVVWWVPIAASYCGPVQLPYAINFTTGIGIGAATTATGSSAPGTGPVVTEFYI